VSTLVCYVDRANDVGRADATPPVVGREHVLDLVTRVGLLDPEDAAVNCLLETVRVADDLRDGGEEAIEAILAGVEGRGGADRAIAAQLDELVAAHEPESVIVVTGSAEGERIVPVIESRVPVDSVDRVVVRQARDIESVYYLLKQFLADEELRGTVLVPTGVALVAFPILQALAGAAVAIAAISAVIGCFLLYKGLGVDDYVADLPAQAQDALYSGDVSVVTYVVAAGLAVLGLFLGGLEVSQYPGADASVIVARFVFDAVPWLAGAALAASAGRLIDDAIGDEPIRRSSINLPFVAVAVGLICRGFAGFFLERAGAIAPATVPGLRLGPLTLQAFPLARGVRLALFILGGIVVSLVGVRAANEIGGPAEPALRLSAEASPTDADGDDRSVERRAADAVRAAEREDGRATRATTDGGEADRSG
jgi:putative membrane protein